MYVSLSSLFEYEHDECLCRMNEGFTGGSAAWQHYSPFIFAEETVCATNYLCSRTLYSCNWRKMGYWTPSSSNMKAFCHIGLSRCRSFQMTHATITGAAVMRPSHGPQILRTWCLQTFLCGDTSSDLCMDKDIEWSWPLTDHHSLCTDHSGNAARHVAQLVREVWTVPRLPWQSCWLLMCWDMKVVSLLHVYVPLTGNGFFSATFSFIFVTSQTDHPV
jgi:hypothetical protein